MSEEEKKIIIDEDWKSQVERERDELEKKKNDPDQEPTRPDPGEIPPASFPMLITSIGTQAMMALGQVPDPVSGRAIYSPDLARHHIDTLVVLQEKTKGNLDADEEEMVGNFINELRQLFIAMQNSNFQFEELPKDT